MHSGVRVPMPFEVRCLNFKMVNFKGKYISFKIIRVIYDEHFVCVLMIGKVEEMSRLGRKI